MPKLPLSSQVVLITGASTGIGKAIALKLAERYSGIRLILTARSQDKLQTLAQECQSLGATVATIPADLAVTEQAQALAEKAQQQFDRLDVLINNAGYGQMGPAELIPPEAAQLQMAVNFHAPLILSQALIPQMRQQGYGRIINISSVAGRLAFPLMGIYSASKFALEALSDALRMELHPFNIKVVIIEPGPVKTEFFQVVGQKIQQFLTNVAESPYAPAMGGFAGMEEMIDRVAWSSDRLAEMVIQAMAAPNPKDRYIAPTNQIFINLIQLLPAGWRDSFWRKNYGLDKIKPTIPN